MNAMHACITCLAREGGVNAIGKEGVEVGFTKMLRPPVKGSNIRSPEGVVNSSSLKNFDSSIKRKV
jgi:hypothetical protein